MALNKYTIIVAIKGSFMQTQVEAENSLEAMRILLARMEPRDEIVSITISETKVVPTR